MSTQAFTAIEIRDLGFAFPADSIDESTPAPAKLFDHFNLTIRDGEFVALIGQNGSGKSTLARLLNGILLPSEGTIRVYGLNTAEESTILKVRSTLGMVFQNPDNQIVASIVEEDVAFALENLGVEPADIRRRVAEALEAVGMSEYAAHAPHLLSGGQKQRVAIAGILAMEPKCIVLDEPTAMLDPMGRREVIEAITKLNREKKITVILITHHMNETVGADRIVVMAQGRVLREGTPSDILNDSALLESAGLRVPDSVALAHELASRGLRIEGNPITPDACAAAISRSINK